MIDVATLINVNTSVGNQQSSPVIVYCSTRTLTDEVTVVFFIVGLYKVFLRSISVSRFC